MDTLEPTTDTEFPAQEADLTRAMFPVDQRHSSQSPLRPGSTLIAYQPNGNSSPKTPARMGKSQHLAQIRSLGLLHDLQEYISSVETLASEQKRELEKVREEKRDMEKFLARAEASNQERERQGATLDFSVSEVADLPPRLRAIVEDNRGLREIVRRYKMRTASLEHQVAQQQSQVLTLAEANDRLKVSLVECSRTPAEVDREEQLRRQLDLKNRQLENLEHGLGVMRAKVDTDSKLYRQNLASAAREKDALKRQLVAANRSLEEREKEVRALNVELRKARRGVPPTRGGGPYHPPGTALGGVDDDGTSAAAAAGAVAALAAPPAPPPAREEPEERIRIMLIIVRDEIQVPVEVPVPVPVPMMVDTPGTPMEGGPRTDPGEGVPTSDGCDPAELAARLQMHQEQQEEQRLDEAEVNPVEPDAGATGPQDAAIAEQPVPQPEEPEAAAPEPSLSSETPPTDDAAPEVAVETHVGNPAAPEPGDPVFDLAAELDALLGPEPVSVSEPQPAASGEEPAAGPSPEEPEAEPSASGLLLEAAGEEGGAEASGQGDEPCDGAATEEVEPSPPQEDDSLSSGSDPAAAPLHSHASQPMPVPYARTSARAIAAKVGGTSVKHPHPPAQGQGLPSQGSGAHRKTSGGAAGLGGVGAVSSKMTSSSQRGPGNSSRKHPA